VKLWEDLFKQYNEQENKINELRDEFIQLLVAATTFWEEIINWDPYIERGACAQEFATALTNAIAIKLKFDK